MTELSPLGTMGVLTGKMQTLSFNERVDMKVKQGRPPFLVQMKITDDDGNELPPIHYLQSNAILKYQCLRH